MRALAAGAATARELARLRIPLGASLGDTCITDRLVGTDPDALRRAARGTLPGPRSESRLPELWDGKAAR